MLVDAAEYLGVNRWRSCWNSASRPDARRDADGATALHTAAYTGRADVVELLIAHGADINARDAQYRSPPLSWASVGSGNPPRHRPQGDWMATIQTLLDAGAELDGGWSTAKPPSDEVAALLQAHGIEPAEGTTSALQRPTADE